MVCLGQKIALTLLTVFLLSNFFGCKEKQPSLPYYNSPEFDPFFLEDKSEIDKVITHRISDFSFTNQNGQKISDKDLVGKVHVANFIFTTCNSICPKMTNHMKIVAEEFKNDSDAVLLSFSVTPWIDDVDRLKAYAEENNIQSSNWHLLTGSRGRIYELARQSYFAEESLGFTRDSTEFLHTEHFILVDGTKRIRGIYNGTLRLEITQLVADIKQLKSEEKSF
jgi:protein SCO1